MPAAEAQPQDWVTAAVQALRNAESWTGRIHVHKLLASVELLGLAHPPFDFVLYYYGPYSRELDLTIAEMQAAGLLEREYPQPGYGPRYKVVYEGSGALTPDQREAIRNTASAFAQRNSNELELLTTCLWMEKRDGVTDEREIASRVSRLKPKYGIEQIIPYVQNARDLEARLRPT